MPHALRTPIRVPTALRPGSAARVEQRRAPSPTDGFRRSPRSQVGLHPLLSPPSSNLNAPPVAYDIAPGPTDPARARGPTAASTARREQTAHKVVHVRLRPGDGAKGRPGGGAKVLQASVVAAEQM